MPRAYVFTAYGGSPVEAFLDLPRPAPGPSKPAAVSFHGRADAAATAYDEIRQLGLPPGATLLITGVGGGLAWRPCRSPRRPASP